MFNSTRCLTSLVELHKDNQVVVDSDVRDYRGFAPLHLAVVKNQLNVLKLLIKDLETNINIKTKNGVSPILLAIKGMKTDI